MADRVRDENTDYRIVKADGSFGVVWQCWRGNVLVDTYCPWNGDDRPDWMPDAE